MTHSASMDSCRLSGTGNTRSARALPDPTGIGRCYSSPSSRRLTAAHPQSTSNLESSPPTRPSYVRKSSPAARCPSNFPSATLTAAGYGSFPCPLPRVQFRNVQRAAERMFVLSSPTLCVFSLLFHMTCDIKFPIFSAALSCIWRVTWV